MIVKGTYTSVWDNDVLATSNVEVDTETHAIEFLDDPIGVEGVNALTAEYVTLPWNSYAREVDPDGDDYVNIRACRKDEVDEVYPKQEVYVYG